MRPTRPRRLVHAAAAALVALVGAPSARGDEVVLDNGRTLVGRVVSDDGTTLRLEMESGTMKIERAHVREVRKSPPPTKRAEPAPAGAPASGAGAKGPAAGAPAGTAAAPEKPRARVSVERPYPRTLAARMEEIGSTELRPWPDEEAKGCEDSPGKPWKVATADGRIEFRTEAPSNDAGLRQVWQMRRQTAGGYVFTKNGAPMMEWAPVYWDAERAAWWSVPPALQVFQRHEAISKQVLESVCGKDLGAWVECNILVQTMGQKQGGSRIRNVAVPIDAERTKLLAAAVRATGSATMGPPAARCLEIEHEMKWETPAGRIRLAQERTALLRQLVASLPPEPTKPPRR